MEIRTLNLCERARLFGGRIYREFSLGQVLCCREPRDIQPSPLNRGGVDPCFLSRGPPYLKYYVIFFDVDDKFFKREVRIERFDRKYWFACVIDASARDGVK